MATEITTMEQMKTYARRVLDALRQRKVAGEATFLTLQGPLGAGKTTLVQQVAHLLGVTNPVTSPTFVLRSEYETGDDSFRSLVHIDAYRIESERDGATIGWDDLSGDEAMLVAVEWPEKVLSFLPKRRYHLTIDLVGDTRVITES